MIKKIGILGFVCRVLFGVLIGSLALPPQMAFSQFKPNEKNVYQTRVAHSSRFILGSKQIRRDYVLKDGEEVVEKEYDLSKIDVAVFTPSTNAQNLQFEYNPASRELVFKRVVFNSKLERFVKTHEHVIQDVDIEGDIKDLLIQDPNVTLFASKNGTIYGSFTPVLMNSLFQAYIPFTPFFSTTLGKTEAFQSPSRISKLSFATPEVAPVDLQSDVDGSHVDLISVHDLMIEITHPDRIENIHIGYYDDLMRRLRAHVMSMTLLLQTVNPRANLIQAMQYILQREAAAMKVAETEFMHSMDDMLDETTNLSSEVLRNLSYRTDLTTLTKMLIPEDHKAQDIFEAAKDERKYTWTAESWRDMFEKIQNVRNIENHVSNEAGIPVESIQSSWADILVKEWKYPNLLTQEHIQKLAKSRNKSMQSFNSDLLQFAKSQFTVGRLALIGAALSLDVANMNTEDAINRYMFSAADTMLGWTQDVWMLGGLIKGAVEGSANLNANFAYTSVATLYCLLVTIQPISYILARSVAVIRGEKNPDGTRWSAAKAFFSYGGRFYAKVTYPFQLGVWWLLGQWNVGKAVLSKRSFVSSGVLHRPYSSSSMKEGEKKMNEGITVEAKNRQRAMLLASVAVSEYLKNKSIKIDPSTLLMLIESVENGRTEKFYELVANNQLIGAWEEISESFYHELVKLHDEKPQFNETQIQQVQKYIDLLNREIANWDEKLKVEGDSLVACTTNKSAVSRGCDFLKKSYLKFKRATSSVAMFILTGGASYLFYQRNKDFVAPDKAVAIADPQYIHDYKGSLQIASIFDTARAPLALNLHSHAEKLFQLISDSLEQACIYGAQGGVEASMIQLIKRFLYNPSPNIGAMYTNRHLDKLSLSHLPSSEQEQYEGMELSGKQSTVGEGFRDLFEALVDPEKGIASIAFAQKRRMDAVIQALQGKGAMGYFPRVFATIMISLIVASRSTEGLASFDWSEIGSSAGSALLKQANVIFNKMAVMSDGTQIVLGYAVIWALVIWVQNTIESKAGQNLSKTEGVDNMFEHAIRLKDSNMLSEAVNKLQQLYREQRKEIPEKFSISSSEMPEEVAVEFFEYSLKDPANYTLVNAWVSWGNNFLIGSLVSTLLAISLSISMYNPDVAVVPQMAKSLEYFALTYLGATAVHKYAPGIVRKTKSLFQKNKKRNGDKDSTNSGCPEVFP